MFTGVPEPYTFTAAEMGDLNMFAELHLTFSLLLTNVLRVDAALHQLHGDKTSSASIEFDRGEFLVSSVVLQVSYLWEMTERSAWFSKTLVGKFWTEY